MPKLGKHYSEGSRLLRAKLDELGITQGKAAQMLGVAFPGHVNRWLTGYAMPGLVFAIEIERVFGVPAAAWTQRSQ